MVSSRHLKEQLQVWKKNGSPIVHNIVNEQIFSEFLFILHVE